MDAVSSTGTPKSSITRLLPIDYKLGENDVYVGRANLYRLHPGNIRFNEIVQSKLERYYYCNSRREKTSIIYDVVDQVRAGCTEGGFVKRSKKTGRWYEVGDVAAREKTSQAFRDATIGIYKSSRSGKSIIEAADRIDAEDTRSNSSNSFGNQQSRIASLQPNVNTDNSSWQQPVNQEGNWYQDRITSRNSSSGSLLEDSKPPAYSQSDKSSEDLTLVASANRKLSPLRNKRKESSTIGELHGSNPPAYSQSRKEMVDSKIVASDDRKLAPIRKKSRDFSKGTSFGSESSSQTSIPSVLVHDSISLEYYSKNVSVASSDNASFLNRIDESKVGDSSRVRNEVVLNPLSDVMSISDAQLPSTATSGAATTSEAAGGPNANVDSTSDQKTFDLLLQLYEKWQ